MRRGFIVSLLLVFIATPAWATSSLADAYRLFYNGRYQEAADLAAAARTHDPDNLAAWELRSSALLFQIRRTFGEPKDKARAWRECDECNALMTAFLEEINEGRARARAILERDPGNVDARFFLGKLNLNYVWLQLGTLGRRTGWNEYREARRSIEAALVRDPSHVRARVARAWIDYIVDTRVPWTVRWMFGSASKERGLQTLQETVSGGGDDFAQAEATFALWDMQVRERNYTEAIALARGLARDFPDNRELARFLSAHDVVGTR